MTAVNQQQPSWLNPLMEKLARLEELLTLALPMLPQTQDGRAAGQFDAIELVGNLLDGKAYWSVRGGPYSKHGASVWPEVLKPAGFDPETMDLRRKVDLAGWTARYTCEVDGSKPKVVELIPPAAAQERPSTPAQTSARQPRAQRTAAASTSQAVIQQPPPPEPPVETAVFPTPAPTVPGNGRDFPVEPDWHSIVLRCTTADAFDGSVVRWLDYFTDATKVQMARETLWGAFDYTAVAGYAAGLEAYAKEVRRQADAGEPNSGSKALAAARQAHDMALG